METGSMQALLIEACCNGSDHRMAGLKTDGYEQPQVEFNFGGLLLRHTASGL